MSSCWEDLSACPEGSGTGMTAGASQRGSFPMHAKMLILPHQLARTASCIHRTRECLIPNAVFASNLGLARMRTIRARSAALVTAGSWCMQHVREASWSPRRS